MPERPPTPPLPIFYLSISVEACSTSSRHRRRSISQGRSAMSTPPPQKEEAGLGGRTSPSPLASCSKQPGAGAGIGTGLAQHLEMRGGKKQPLLPRRNGGYFGPLAFGPPRIRDEGRHPEVFNIHSRVPPPKGREERSIYSIPTTHEIGPWFAAEFFARAFATCDNARSLCIAGRESL